VRRDVLLVVALIGTLAVPTLAWAQMPEWQAKSVALLPKLSTKIQMAHFSDNTLLLAVDRPGVNWRLEHDAICRLLNQLGRPVGVSVPVKYADKNDWLPMPFAEYECGALTRPYTDQPESLGVMGADGVIRPE